MTRNTDIYMIYNSVKKEKFKSEMYLGQAERTRSRFGLVAISKEEAERMGLNEYKEIAI